MHDCMIFSKESDYVFDFMIGGGTTTIRYKLLNTRNLLAFHINPKKAAQFTKQLLKFEFKFNQKIKMELNDTRYLDMLKNGSIDFILAYLPYVDIIKYSGKK